jgi:hypothetical protein
VIIKTAKSIYEVQPHHRRFRKVHAFDAGGELPVGQWFRYEQMSPVEAGARVRFYWRAASGGGRNRIAMWTTSPVVDVLPDLDAPLRSGSAAGA